MKQSASGGADNKRKATDGMSRKQTKEFKRLRRVASIAHGIVSDFKTNGTSAAPVRNTTPKNTDPSDQFGTRIRSLESLVSDKDRSDN